MVIGYCEYKRIKFRLANNGDDCVVFLEERDLPKLRGIDSWMLSFGFTLTREDPVFELEKVVFCQAQPVFTSTGWRMVRDPRTAMSKDCVSLVGWDTRDDIRAWAAAIASCGLSLTRGVPVWEAWYRQLERFGAGADRVGVQERVNECGMYYMSRGVTGGEVSAEARVSFWRAFGLLPDLQIALEAWYATPLDVGSSIPMMFTDIISLDKSNNPLSAWLGSK